MSDPLSLAHPSRKSQKVGVVLLNLGTPDATDYRSVRRYLKEFLSDSRVIETPRWRWCPVLNLIVLSMRPQKSGHAYEKIWDKTRNESPLLRITREQTNALAQRLSEDNVMVDFAMRYGNPSTGSVLDNMQAAGCQRILLMPLYPQYSATTTATANDKAFDALRQMRWQPAIRTAPAYYDDPKYIAVLGDSIRNGVAALDFQPDVVLTSYHGMPVAYRDKGDPYYYQCHETTRMLRDYLGWPEDRLMVTFQSRFDSSPWLEPYTDRTLESLPSQGIKKIAILAPAFSSDCLETLEEISIAGRNTFLKTGGEKFAYIPCLNASQGSMDMLEYLVRRELAGWL